MKILILGQLTIGLLIGTNGLGAAKQNPVTRGKMTSMALIWVGG
ncbi:MAG: DMT family transporter [Lachnospiraceae bacterium]|nr:DMT family transporter [Lachnospiraceae bacterium]